MAIEPGPLLASGRAADVYDQGDGTVLRRYRIDHGTDDELRVMRWLAEQGVPVPAVHHADGRDLVMERVVGPTMLEDLQRRPWMLLRHAATLARLQRELAAVAAPDWLPTKAGVPPGDALVHLDLHPMNVLLGPRGPVIIDWTNATRGAAAFDAGYTYVLMATFEVSGCATAWRSRCWCGPSRRTGVGDWCASCCPRRASASSPTRAPPRVSGSPRSASRRADRSVPTAGTGPYGPLR